MTNVELMAMVERLGLRIVNAADEAKVNALAKRFHEVSDGTRVGDVMLAMVNAMAAAIVSRKISETSKAALSLVFIDLFNTAMKYHADKADTDSD